MGRLLWGGGSGKGGGEGRVEVGVECGGRGVGRR